MKRFVYKLILISAIVSSTTALAQREKIEILEKVLSTLNDTIRIDVLNELSKNYIGLDNDSAVVYAEIASKEALALNYFHGAAESVFNNGEVEMSKDNFRAAEQLYRESIKWYKQTPNKKGIENAYLKLGSSLFSQSFFEDARRYLDSSYSMYRESGDQIGMSVAFSILQKLALLKKEKELQQ